MASIAEPAPVGMTLPAFRKGDVISFSFTHNLHPEILQELHVMKAHPGNVADTLLIFRIWFFKEGIIPLREGIANGIVPDRREHYQREDNHSNNAPVFFQ